MKKIILDTLTIHDQPSPADYKVDSRGISGFESPEVRMSAFNRPAQDGAFVSTNFYGARTISIPITVLGSTAAGYESARQALFDAVKVERASTGKATTKTATFTTPDDEVYRIEFTLAKIDLIRKYPKYTEGMVHLYCPESEILDDTETSESITLSEGGGFEIASDTAKNRYALYFPADSAVINVPYHASIGYSGNDLLTIAAWIKLDSVSNTQRVITQSNEIVLRVTSGDALEFICNSFSSNDRVSGGTINVDEWTHVLGMYDGTDLKVYINGVEEGSATPTGTYGGSVSAWTININSAEGLVGFIDQIRIWGGSLTDAEITALVASDTMPAATLDGAWLLDEGTGTNAEDTSANSNDGTLGNSPEWTTDVGISTGGFDISFDIDSKQGGELTVANDGDLDAYPVLTLAGPLSNPTITNATTGKFIQLSGLSLAAGESVTIDMKARTILKGTQNYFSYKTATSSFWTLQPGNNLIQLTDTSYDAQASVTITYRDTYSGI